MNKKNPRKEDRLLEKLLETIEGLKETVEAQEVESLPEASVSEGEDDVDEADDGSTSKYDEDKHLTPKQGKNLPDAMQKAIIDKEKKKREEIASEKNEGIVRLVVRKVLKNIA